MNTEVEFLVRIAALYPSPPTYIFEILQMISLLLFSFTGEARLKSSPDISFHAAMRSAHQIKPLNFTQSAPMQPAGRNGRSGVRPEEFHSGIPGRSLWMARLLARVC